MSFMFKPFKFTDPEALNVPALPEAVKQSRMVGNDAIAACLLKSTGAHGILLLDGHIGAQFEALVDRITALASGPVKRISVEQAYRSPEALETMLAESLPQDTVRDPILLFGKSIPHTINDLMDQKKLEKLAEETVQHADDFQLTIVYGLGSLVPALRKIADNSAYMDVAPLETTLRIQAHRTRNAGDAGQPRSLRYIFRRMYYFDYEVSMLHRMELLKSNSVQWYIDSNMEDRLKMLPLASLKTVFAAVLEQPFRCTPVYLEGVWGGKFVKELRHLPGDMRNCAWVFDMIPNEVSLQIKVGGDTFNIPFSTFFKETAESLMGPESVKRFGHFFPIRFNYDDTYNGSGNMSIQVHPPQAYNQENFGEPFQQDESYYCVKTAGSKTYLGLQDDCNIGEFFQCIERAEKEHIPFDHDKYVNSFPSTEGDQFLLPGGTIHASGRNQVVLEIGSYTIGSYTFKLYDYLRKDLDGNPRPIHSFHGKNVLVTERRRSKIDGVLRPRPVTVREGDGWKEEIVGEHDLIYFSLRRLSFDHAVSDSTEGKKFHVLALVKGESVLVYAKNDPAKCYKANYLDVIVIPAAMGEYGIINLGKAPCQVTKTLLK